MKLSKSYLRYPIKKLQSRFLCYIVVDTLSHVKNGLPQMVDISQKISTHRIAHAQAEIHLPTNVIDKFSLTDKKEIVSSKGPVFTTSIIAGVLATKKTSDLIPFCHPLAIDDVKIEIKFQNDAILQVDCIVKTFGKTGVEMEALVGVTNASLCVYDMLKALSHDIVIKNIHLLRKQGGKSDKENIT